MTWMALGVGLSLFLLAPVQPSQPPNLLPVAAMYPGGTLTEAVRAATFKCGIQYRYTANATEEQIVAFYAARARAAHLDRGADTNDKSSKVPGWRMIIFVEKPAGRVLTVIIDSEQRPLKTSVLYLLPGSAPCSKRR
jgi:hypothetical protein